MIKQRSIMENLSAVIQDILIQGVTEFFDGVSSKQLTQEILAAVAEEFIVYIKEKIKTADNTAEELIQERDNAEEAEKYFGKTEAYKECIAELEKLIS
jgi:hypothetical protein